MTREAHSAWVCGAAFAWLLLGCEPELVAGAWTCGQAPLVIDGDGGMTKASTQPVVIPWTTSFEDGFCGYTEAGGFCYSDPDASYALSSEVTRSGRRVAAFAISTDPSRNGLQARCVREGLLPEAAYYGAWYYVPVVTTNTGNWNLMHIRGADYGAPLHGLWDVSIDDAANDRYSLVVRDFLRDRVLVVEGAEVAAGEWFRVDFFLQRAADASGEIALYLNGQQVLSVTDISTDDSTWGQWYIGNLASRSALRPSESVVYVDDVSIKSTL